VVLVFLGMLQNHVVRLLLRKEWKYIPFLITLFMPGYDHIIVWIFFFDYEWRDVASVLVVKSLLFSVIEWQQAVPWIFLCILEMLVVER